MNRPVAGPTSLAGIGCEGDVMTQPPSRHRARAARLVGRWTLVCALGLTACGELTEGGVVSVAYTPDNRLVAFGNGATHVFDADARQEIQAFSSPWEISWLPVPAQLSLSRDGTTVAVANGKAVDVYAVASGVRLAHIPVYDAPEERFPIAGVALSGNGELVAVAVRPTFYGAPRLGIWRVADQSLAGDAQQPAERKYWSWGAGLAFSLDGKILYALLSDDSRTRPGTTYVTSWDARDGSSRLETAIFNDVENEIFGWANLLSLSADGLTLATVGSELLRWDASTLTLLPDFPAPAPTAFGANSIAFSPDGRDLVTTHATNSAPDPQIVGPDGAVVRSWSIAESGMCESAVFSPDGTRIAAACGQYLRIWDLASGAQVQARKVTGKVY
jgi:WD40 repeat protein